jgi:2-keto-3-deoxy-L-rhamnonate aldolase RhmA
MKINTFKQRLADGGVAIGTTIFEFNTTGIGQIVSNAGADFVLFDMEHTGWSVETIRGLIATTRAADVIPIVRVPALHSDVIARVLDVGAMGIMAPMIETAEQAEQLVRAAKYPPEGGRGAAFGIAHDNYLFGDASTKMRSANREGMVIPLIESVTGIANAASIAAVEGVDCLWLGSLDLSLSLGEPGTFTSPPFLAAVDQLVAAGTSHRKALGVAAGNAEDAGRWIDRGFGAISYSIDLVLFQQALAQGVSTVRQHHRANPTTS